MNDAPVAADDPYTSEALQLGSIASGGSLRDWGTVNDDGSISISSGSITGTITAFASSGEAAQLVTTSRGLGVNANGVGNDVSGEVELGEKVVMEFDASLSDATIGFDSLFGRFDAHRGQDARVSWVAYEEGFVVASGEVASDVNNTDGDGRIETNAIHIAQSFDQLEFVTIAPSGGNANFTISYIEAFRNDPIVTQEDTAVTIDASGLLTNDTDIDGDALSILSVQDATHGTVGLDANGNVVFVPEANYNGPASFTYTVSDGQGGTDTATVNLTVADVNDAPVVTVVDTTATEDVAQVIANVSDIDGTIDASSISADNGTVTLDAITGDITYTPDANFNGTDTVTISVTDNDGTTTTQTFDVTVASVNDAPVAADDTHIAQPVLLGNKGTGDSLTDWGAANADGSVSISAGSLTGTITAFASTGAAAELVTTSRGLGIDANRAGNDVSGEIELGEKVVVELDTPLSDATIGFDSLFGRFDAHRGQDARVSWVAYEDGVVVASGEVASDVNNTDGDGRIETNTIHIADSFDQLEFVTTAPGGGNANFTISYIEAIANALVIQEDKALTIDAADLLANDSDIDGDALTVTSVQDAVNGTVSLDAQGNAVFTPDANYNGPASFTYTVSDGQGGTTTATVNLTVTDVNDAPVITIVDTTSTEDVAQVIANVSDIDGTVDAASLNADNGTVTLDAATGDINYTPDADFNGSDTITISITDNDGTTITQTVDVNVASVNDAPVITVIDTIATEDIAQVIANVSDIDGTIDASSINADNGTVTLDATTGDITYTPDANFNGADTIVVSVTDNDGTTTTQTFSVTVANVNDEPVATDDIAQTRYNNLLTLDVTANDSDIDNDTLRITQVNGHAIIEGGAAIDIDGVAVSLVSGNLVFDGSAAYADLLFGESASKAFTYTVSDGNGGSSTADAAVTFNGATDTLAKVEAQITNDVMGLQVIAEDYYVGNGVGDGAFTVKLSNAGELDGIHAEAYCLDIFAPLMPSGFGTNIDDAFLTGALATIAHTDFLTDDQEEFLGTGGINGQSAADNLDLINWIINQDFEEVDNGDGNAETYTGAEVQGAIWALTNGDTLEDFGEPGGVFVNPLFGSVDNAQEIVDLALANGEGFEAGEGDVVGVYIDPVTTPGFTQPFIVAIDLYEDFNS